MALINISQGQYTLAKNLKAVLRTNLNSTLSTLSSSEGVADYLPDNVQVGALTGSNIYLGDLRTEPQAKQYLLLGVSRAGQSYSLTAGLANSTYDLTIRAGVHAFRKAATGADVPTVSDAGFQVAGLLLRAAEYTVVRYLPQSTPGVYNVLSRSARPLSVRPQTPNVFEYELRLTAFLRTRESFLEGA